MNSSIDWNSNTRTDSDVRVNLNPEDGMTVGILKGAPNEYLALQFGGGILGSTGPAVGVSDTETAPSRRFSTLLDSSASGATTGADPAELTHAQFLERIVPMLRQMPRPDLSKLMPASTGFQALRVRSAAKSLSTP